MNDQRGHRSLGSSTATSITVYGMDLCADILGSVDFAGMLYLGLLDRVPNAAESRVLNSLLVSLVEHGVTPSTIAARMTYFGAPESLQGAIAAGLLGLGSVLVGTIEGAARMLQEELAGSAATATDEERAARIVGQFRADRRQIPGLGHPIHKPTDPRAARLFEIAAEEQVAGSHCHLMEAVHLAAEAQYGKQMTLNVTGAIGAIASDLGIPWHVARGIGVAARSVGLIAHLRDEQLAPTSNGIWHEVEESQRQAFQE
jgi:citrate synthase